MPSAIEVMRLTKTYRNGTEALKGVDFDCPQGSATAYIGANGSGKTTTINILAGTLRPTSGHVRIMGSDVGRRGIVSGSLVGLCPQDFAMDPILSVRENLSVFGSLRGLTRQKLALRISSLLDRMGASTLADKMLFQLSWGETKKVQIIRELLVPPRVLLLDEPTAGLDPTTTLAVLHVLKECNDQGSTLFVSSHQMDDLQALCSTVLFIDSGAIVETGTMEEFIDKFGGRIRVSVALPQEASADFSQKIAIELPGTEVLPGSPVQIIMSDEKNLYSRLLRFLSEYEPRISGLEVSRPTLKDAWLNLSRRREHR